MALGILEAGDEHVPGTVHLADEQRRTAELLDRDTTLHRTKDGKIILVPQPNIADPNDPLTWPLWRRDMMLAILCLVAVVATTATPLLAANTVTIATLGFRRNFQAGALLTAYHLAACAVGAFFAVPFARVFGKRGIFLFAALLMVGSSTWAGTTRASRNYASMLWARVFQGVAVAPFESLVNACVGDLFFVHERGPRMAITNVCLFAGAFLTPVIVGVMTDKVGWQWTFYALAIIEGFAFLLLFFFVPETAYVRPAHLDTDITTPHRSGSDEFPSPDFDGQILDGKEAWNPAVLATVPRKSYLKQLMPFDGIKTNTNFLILLFRPFPLFFHPAIIWACLMQGVIIGWTVMVGVIISLIFIGPPLFWSEEETGFIYAGPVVGSVLALLFSGVFTELTTKYLVRRNNGKYEPEFRLFLCLPTLIFAGIGLYGFGITANNIRYYGYHSVGVFFSFIIICMVTGTIASAQYILDAHRDISVEAFTNMIIFKNLFSFVLAYFAYGWVVRHNNGLQAMFISFGTLEIIICLLAIPMYVFGKRNRAFFHKYDLLRMARLR